MPVLEVLKAADDLSIVVVEQAYREINRLLGLGSLIDGWTEPFSQYLLPGLKWVKEDRVKATEFLKELVRVVVTTAPWQTLLVVSYRWVHFYSNDANGNSSSTSRMQCC